MSAEYPEEPHDDPIWERTRLLIGIEEHIQTNTCNAAFRVVDGPNFLTVLEGRVEPFESEDEVLYKDMPAFLIACTSFSGSRRAAMAFGAMLSSKLFVYDLQPSQASLQLLLPTDTVHDEYNLHKIQRTAFHPLESQAFASRIFDAPIYTRWHTSLGIEPTLTPNKLDL